MPPDTPGRTGKIFSLSGKVGGARAPHPHVVVIELAEDCLLVPAYTSGGYEIEEFKRTAFAALGIREDQGWVEIDNAVHVRFYDGRAGNLATWLVARPDRWTHKELAAFTPIGEMDDAGLLLVVSTLAALMEARPEPFSPHLRKKVKKLAAELRGRTVSPPPGPS